MSQYNHPTIENVDRDIIHFFRKISDPLARFGLFVVFFWFGALKVFDLSPATPMVHELFNKTIPFIPFSVFIIFFGIFEMIIGLMFIVKGWERQVIPLLFFHMFTTSLPLFLMPGWTWSGMLIPTMEAQYIIKNVVIIATAIAVAAHVHPLPRKRNS